MAITNKQFKTCIKSKTGLFELNLRELFQNRGLIWIFFKRSYSTRYKQTILGPLWLAITPILTVVTQAIVFGVIAGLSTAGMPKIVFYLCSNNLWGFFAGCFGAGCWAFTGGTWIMGKIYFPRLILPISNVIICFFDYLISFTLFICVVLIYHFSGTPMSVSPYVFLAPLFLLETALFGLGLGTIIASVTTKYRDLHVLVGFGMHLWMYGSPVVYTLELVPPEYMHLYMLNPMAVIVDGYRNCILNTGGIQWYYWGVSWVVTIVLLIFGILIFNRIEKTFMDTV